MFRRVITIGALSVLAGCSSLETLEYQAASSHDAIIGGSTTSADEAVVVLAAGHAGQFQEYCTGTLVAPQTVLTAAHCINVYGPGNFYYVVFGPNIRSPTKAVRIAAQFANPCYEVSSPSCPNNETQVFYDFGLLKLEAPVTDVTPIELNPTPLTNSDVGKKIRHVGYGVVDAAGNGGGTKREVTYNVRSIQPLGIESGMMGAQTCSGDSGGPAFMVTAGSTRERVVGVISFGDENCRQYGFDGRVDAALPWLNATLGGWETPSCNADGRCAVGCPQVDEDCVPEGATCTRPEVCESRQCVRDGTNAASYCSKPCQADGDCGRGLECGPVGLCILKPKVPRSTLEACDEYEDLCIGGNLCAGPKDGITRCVNACTTQADCESSTTCETGAGNKRFCRPPESVVRFFPLLVPQAKLTGDTGGGCSSGSGLSTAALWVLLALALGARSKQRHRAD